MAADVEIELKFLVPAKARAAVVAEMSRETASSGRIRLSAMYLDTPDRRLARAGLAWRLRREGRRWVQTLKAPGAGALERFEHEVLRPGPEPDARLHAGTAAGERLLELLRRAEKDDRPVGVRYRTEVRRLLRRVRTRGAVVEIAFDEGRIAASAPGASGPALPLCELEFELVSGSAAAMLGLARRWRRRFGLVIDPRSKAERGDRLAEGQRFPAVRRAAEIDYPRNADAAQAFAAVLDECQDQILRNGIGLAVGDPGLRVEHVHQLRVGIRRLRSALRAFRGFAAAQPPDALVQGVQALFTQLGQARDRDVLAGGVAAALVQAGAPPMAAPRPATTHEADAATAIRDPQAQELLLDWIAWRTAAAEDAIRGEAAPASPLAAPAIEAATRAAAPPDPEAAERPAGSRQEAVPARADTAQGAPQMGAVDRECVPTAAHGAAHPDAGTGTGTIDDTGTGTSTSTSTVDTTGTADDTSAAGNASTPDSTKAERDFPRDAARRLRRWHRRIAADAAAFDSLDEAGLHALRKRIKRQRYAVEFFAPVLRRSQGSAYLKRLRPAQERMGELNDLFVARARYQAMLPEDPGAWFALGWLAARIAEQLAQARTALERLARGDPPED